MISPTDIVSVQVSSGDIDSEHLQRIAGNTVNTWQPDRTASEIIDDTLIGKVAECALDRFVRESSIGHITWDEIRSDDFATHAPVDGFLMTHATMATLDRSAFAKKANASIESNHLTPDFRDLCEGRGVFGYELKSTRVTSRLRNCDGSFNLGGVLQDDFLLYPRVRHGSLTNELRQQLLLPEEKDRIQLQAPRTLFRAYVDADGSNYLVYLIGYIPRESFFASPYFKVKPMKHLGKSERAIYYAVSLKRGFPMRGIVSYFTKG